MSYWVDAHLGEIMSRLDYAIRKSRLKNKVLREFDWTIKDLEEQLYDSAESMRLEDLLRILELLNIDPFEFLSPDFYTWPLSLGLTRDLLEEKPILRIVQR